MKVLCVGTIKTGTKSMREALDILGYKNVHDIMEQFKHDKEFIDKAIFEKTADVDDYKNAFYDVDGITDGPFVFHWREILEAFPDVKVVLTVRDNSEAWFKSVQNMATISKRDLVYIKHEWMTRLFLWNRFCPLFRISCKVGEYILRKSAGCAWGFQDLDRQTAVECHEMHNADVIKHCPSDKLLVFNCKDGWQPLCDFLNKEIPDSPFPHNNINHSFAAEIRENKFKYSANILPNMVYELLRIGAVIACVGVAFSSIAVKYFVL